MEAKDPETKEPEKKQGVKRKNLNAKAHIITYQNVHRYGSITPEEIKDHYLATFGSNVKRMAVGFEPYPTTEEPYEEDHNGDVVERLHAHVCVEWIKKKKFKTGSGHTDLHLMKMEGEDSWLFPMADVATAREAKNKRANINNMMSYVRKEAKFGYPGLLYMPAPLGTYDGSEKYLRDRGAYQQLEDEIERSWQKQFEFPVTFYGQEFKLSMNDKRRHFWIYGEKDCGKSTNCGSIWAETNGINHYLTEMARGQECNGAFDSYQQQRLVIIEDQRYPLEAIQKLCDYTGLMRRNNIVPCSRNIRPPVYWDKKMVIIVTDNREPGARWGQDWTTFPEFMARFIVIEVEKGSNGLARIKRIT